MNKIDIWTDGSVNMKNGNKCAWAFICFLNGELIYDKADLLYEDHRTGNIAEMSAIINSLKWLDEIIKKTDLDPTRFDVNVYSDSQYCIKGINEWIKNWKMKFFRGVKNREYWEEFYSLAYEKHNYNSLTFNWVKGHSGIKENEMVDALCYELTKSDKSNNRKRV